MLPAKWPQWIIIPICFILVAVVAGLGLGLVAVAQASAPQPTAVPSPTPFAIQFTGFTSTPCVTCHTDQAKLSDSGASDEEIQTLFIDPANTQVLHGRLGCVTCHAGDPGTEDVTAAHQGIVDNPTSDPQAVCLNCHHDLTNEYPADKLIAPHQQVVDGMAKDLTCSDCHGSVGHGFDPQTGATTISMQACLNCHEERHLKIQVQNCDGCHTETPAWDPQMDCSVCHKEESTAKESYEKTLEDQNLLAYDHAQQGLTCLDCHKDVHAAGFGNKPITSHLSVDMDFCFSCHTDNQHTSYDQIIGRTQNFMIDGVNINPHNPHVDAVNPPGVIECRTCHQMHEPSPLVTGCYSCHHEGTFEACSSCHDE